MKKHFVPTGPPTRRVTGRAGFTRGGEVNKSFQKRWCMLKGNLLFYGEKLTDKYY